MNDNIYDTIIGLANDINGGGEVNVKEWCDYIVKYTQELKKKAEENNARCPFSRKDGHQIEYDGELHWHEDEPLCKMAKFFDGTWKCLYGDGKKHMNCPRCKGCLD